MPQITRKSRNLSAPPLPVGPAFAFGDGPVFQWPYDSPSGTTVVDPKLGRIALRRGQDGRLVGGIEPPKP